MRKSRNSRSRNAWKVIFVDTITDDDVRVHDNQNEVMDYKLYFYPTAAAAEADKDNRDPKVDRWVLDPDDTEYWKEMRIGYTDPTSGIITHSIDRRCLVYRCKKPVKRTFHFSTWSRASARASAFQEKDEHFSVKRNKMTKTYLVGRDGRW